MKAILAIGGSDSGAASGIQADLKTIAAHGAYAVTALTAVTAQTANKARTSVALPAHVVTSQLNAAFEGFDVAAVKSGMVANAAVVEAVAQALRRRRPPHYVLDPVLTAGSGLPLLAGDAVVTLKRRLMPLADLITPNAPEAAALAGMSVTTLEAARAAARRLVDAGCQAVLVKGGHLAAGSATDVLVTPTGETVIEGDWLPDAQARGTGCTLAAAIATRLADGATLLEAVRSAKSYLADVLRNVQPVGGATGPLDHFHCWRPQ